jgi:threonine dehydratase
VAWVARELGVPCDVVVPDHAPETKLAAIARLGGRVHKVSFDDWWRVFQEHRYPGMEGKFVHPVDDVDVQTGNGTIGLEIVEDLPDVDAVVVPFGGGGLITGIGSAVKALRPKARVYAAEVDTAAPLAASMAAGKASEIDYRASFVDGIGGKSVLPEMWPVVREVVDDSLVVPLASVADAVRLLVERARVVAEGAGATSVAAALAGRAGRGKIVCVISGGNIDSGKLATILRGEIP